MGDRGNIYIKDTDTSGVYFYSHWTGSDLPVVLKEALAREQRWDDPSYLARIIFDQMTAGRQGNETGFGISSDLGDGCGTVVVVNGNAATVQFIREGSEANPYDGWSATFAEYIKMSDADILARFEEAGR